MSSKKETKITLNEFKAWLEGFEEAIDGAPNKKQWEKIKDRLDSVIAGEKNDFYKWGWYPWFVYTYYPNYVYPSSPSRIIDTGSTCTGSVTVGYNANNVNAGPKTLDSDDIAKEIGRAEALSLS